ncbi:MAG: hypothetical protein ACRC18_06555 [Cetobacterium sp.]
MQKIKDLARDYANRFQDCFTIESTDSWISRFGGSRFDNSLQAYELSEDEQTSKNREVFVNEFLIESKRLIEIRTVKVDEKGNKTKLVKRKKD